MIGLHQVRRGVQEEVIFAEGHLEIHPHTSVVYIDLQNTASLTVGGGRDGQIVVVEIAPRINTYTLTLSLDTPLVLNSTNPAALLWRRAGEWSGRVL